LLPGGQAVSSHANRDVTYLEIARFLEKPIKTMKGVSTSTETAGLS
jgi:hypothetical protein